jgi:phage baseplate assembly protein V
MSAVGDHDRQIGNLIMLGVIAELDEAQARVRVDCDGLRTDWIPWVEYRAGPGLRTWSAPEVGEQVVVLCPCGDPAQGVVMGSVYQEAHDAPAVAKAVHRVEFGDGSVVEYDRSTAALSITVGTGSVTINCATAIVHASESVTLDTPETHATGNLKVDGKIDAVGDITTPAEVKAGPIGLKAHKHTAQGATAPTTAAQP